MAEKTLTLRQVERQLNDLLAGRLINVSSESAVSCCTPRSEILCRLGISLLFFVVLNCIGCGPGKWVTETADSSHNASYRTSLAFDTWSRASISYVDGSPNHDLMYAHFNGSTWDIETVDTGIAAGGDTSIAFRPNGRPAIAYWDSTKHSIKYAELGAFRWRVVTVDTAGSFPSLAFDKNGNPAISYHWAGLMYAHDTDGDGDFGDSGEVTTVDSTTEVHYETSLAFDPSGNPGITYYDNTNDCVRFAYDANGDGDFADTNEITAINLISGVGDGGGYNSLAFDDSGKPGIAYGATGSKVKYAFYKSPKWQIEDVDLSTHWVSGVEVRLALGAPALAFDKSDNPAIAYYDSTNGDLRYATRKKAASSWSVMTVDSSGDVGTDCWLVFDPLGRPGIAYTERFGYPKKNQLKFAHRK